MCNCSSLSIIARKLYPLGLNLILILLLPVILTLLLIMIILQFTQPQLDISSCSYQSYSVIALILLCLTVPFFTATGCFRLAQTLHIRTSIYNSMVGCSIWNQLIASASNARRKIVIVRGTVEHYYNFHTCIVSTVNSKCYSKTYCYRLIQYCCHQ